MKAKAKKIKDTIKKHGHGHNHDQEYHEGHIPDDHDLDEEDDEEEDEIVQDPEVHGAPSMLAFNSSFFPVLFSFSFLTCGMSCRVFESVRVCRC